MKSLDWLTARPIAHRGWVTDAAPENSLAAFEEAAKLGYPIELDVQLTRDGTVFVFHDFDLVRVCGKPISTFSLKEKDLQKHKLRRSDQSIPTFRDTLALVDGRVGLVVELKVMFHYKKLCDKVIAALEGYEGDVVLQGFSTRAMKYLRSKCDYPIGIIGMDYRRVGCVGLYGAYMNSLPHFKEIKPDFLNYNLAHIPSSATKKCKKEGITVLSWTIKTPKQLEKARQVADNAIVDTYHLKELD